MSKLKNMSNEIENDYADEVQKKKLKTGRNIALGVVLLYVVFGMLILARNAVILPVFMGAVVLLFAPVTALFYVREVRRGVFKASDNN